MMDEHWHEAKPSDVVLRVLYECCEKLDPPEQLAVMWEVADAILEGLKSYETSRSNPTKGPKA